MLPPNPRWGASADSLQWQETSKLSHYGAGLWQAEPPGEEKQASLCELGRNYFYKLALRCVRVAVFRVEGNLNTGNVQQAIGCVFDQIAFLNGSAMSATPSETRYVQSFPF